MKEARKCARFNVNEFHDLLGVNAFLVGIEPSAILTFRDEYPDLLRGDDQKRAQEVARHTLTIEEFLARELDAGILTPLHFPTDKKKILVHGHCHQKALSSMVPTRKILDACENYEVQTIPSGCCGMAGSFGYEKEHYEVSMKIGRLVLFPQIRSSQKDTVIIASGTSCRHQILDGTGRQAKHLVEVI